MDTGETQATPSELHFARGEALIHLMPHHSLDLRIITSQSYRRADTDPTLWVCSLEWARGGGCNLRDPNLLFSFPHFGHSRTSRELLHSGQRDAMGAVILSLIGSRIDKVNVDSRALHESTMTSLVFVPRTSPPFIWLRTTLPQTRRFPVPTRTAASPRPRRAFLIQSLMDCATIRRCAANGPGQGYRRP